MSRQSILSTEGPTRCQTDGYRSPELTHSESIPEYFIVFAQSAVWLCSCPCRHGLKGGFEEAARARIRCATLRTARSLDWRTGGEKAAVHSKPRVISICVDIIKLTNAMIMRMLIPNTVCELRRPIPISLTSGWSFGAQDGLPRHSAVTSRGHNLIQTE